MATINIILTISLTTLISGSKQGQIQYLVFYSPGNNSLENNFYDKSIEIKFDFQTQYQNLKITNITRDVERAILHKDYRVVSISGYSYLYPGLEGGYQQLKDGTKMFIGLDRRYEEYVKNNGFKVIKGTSDMFYAGAPPLQEAAYEYAKSYNILLLKTVK